MGSHAEASALVPHSESSLATAIRDMRPDSYPDSGPLVSIVVVTRDGAHHLQRLFDGLEHRTRYRSFEVIVVDNGSSDETAELLGGEWSFPLTTIRYERNTSFSFANNAGVESASGELVLFLNNDVDPISYDWLGAMVTDLTDSSEVAAVGALLVYPERVPPEIGSFIHPNLTVQHAGIAFKFRRGALRADNLYAGSDPLAPDLARTTRVPALTAACLIARTADVEDIGGFDTGYVYGSEDWDLSLSLSQKGVLVRSGTAALFHHEYGTQDSTPAPEKAVNRRLNQIHFDKRWGPSIFRHLLSDRLNGSSRYGDGSRPRLWFGMDERTTDLDRRAVEVLADELRARNWDVSTAETRPDAPDVVIAVAPTVEPKRQGPHPVHVAWVIDRIRTWTENVLAAQFDIVAAADPLAVDLLANRLHMPIVYLPPGPTSSRRTEASPSYEADLGMWAVDEPQAKKGLELLDGEGDDRVALFGPGWRGLSEVVDRWKGDPGLDEVPSVMASIPQWVAYPERGRVGPSPLVMDMVNNGAIPLMARWDDAVGLFGSPRLYVRDREQMHSKRRELQSTRENLEDLLVSSGHTAGARVDALIGALETHADSLRIGIRICAPNREVSPRWGDTHFAEQFGGALHRLGVVTGVHVAEEWNLPQNQTYEVVIHLRGVKPMTPAPGAFNVLWIVSHPEEVDREECERFDLVLVASAKHADYMAGSLDVPVREFLQATDTGLFAPSRAVDARYSHEIVFVGNARWPVRQAPRWMLENDVPFSLYGANWEGFPEERRRVGDFVPNDDLPALYRSAGIVVNDHWPDMAEHGFISNRIFDVLGSGGFVISDHVEGMDVVFDGAVPTFQSANEMVRALRTYSQDPDRRLRHSVAGMEVVRRHHSFQRRAEEFMELLSTHSKVLG